MKILLMSLILTGLLLFATVAAAQNVAPAPEKKALAVVEVEQHGVNPPDFQRRWNGQPRGPMFRGGRGGPSGPHAVAPDKAKGPVCKCPWHQKHAKKGHGVRQHRGR